MARTTIAIDTKVRDRLKAYGTKGMEYGEIVTRLMDEVDREGFVREMRRLASEPGFVPLG